MEAKLTNIQIKDGVTKTKVLRYLMKNEYANNIIQAKTLFDAWCAMGALLPTYVARDIESLITFTKELVETDFEKEMREEKEFREKEMSEANQWLTTLTAKEKHYINILNRRYIPSAL